MIEGGDRIVLPGFVDTHRHTWQSLIRHVSTDWTLPQYFSGVRGVLGRIYSPEDMYAANLIGALEALDSGITTLVDWSHNNNTPDHADAAIKGLKDAGLRAVFAYGNANDEWLPVNDVPTSDDIKRIKDEQFSSTDQLVTLAMALRGPQFATPEANEHDFRLAREVGLPITVHVGDALWGLNGPLRQLEGIGQLGPDVTFVHCNTIADDEFDLIAGSGGAISVAPELEMTMGHGKLATLRAMERSIPVSLSIDVCTSVGGDMFSAMRAVLAGTRYEVNLRAIEDRTTVDPLPLLATDVLGFATPGERGSMAGRPHRVDQPRKEGRPDHDPARQLEHDPDEQPFRGGGRERAPRSGRHRLCRRPARETGRKAARPQHGRRPPAGRRRPRSHHEGCRNRQPGQVASGALSGRDA